MKQNNWVTCNTPITEYRVDSKGIHLIRTTTPGNRPKDVRKPGADDSKPRKVDVKSDKPE